MPLMAGRRAHFSLFLHSTLRLFGVSSSGGLVCPSLTPGSFRGTPPPTPTLLRYLASPSAHLFPFPSCPLVQALLLLIARGGLPHLPPPAYSPGLSARPLPLGLRPLDSSTGGGYLMAVPHQC